MENSQAFKRKSDRLSLNRVLVAFVLSVSTATHASNAVAAEPPVEILNVPVRAEDVATVDGLMRAFYAVVNVRPGGVRQWGRDRTLYSPWIRFVGIAQPASGQPAIDVWDHQQLVNASEPLVRSGFSEREIHRTTRVYGHIAHVDSTYETEYASPTGLKRSRGVNSIEMYFDGRRWWISSVMWMTEGPQTPIPPELLPR